MYKITGIERIKSMANLFRRKKMDNYAVIIGLDREPSDHDIAILSKNRCLGGANKVLYLQINMKENRDVLAQSSNMVFEKTFKDIAIKEWAAKDIHASYNHIQLEKYIFPDDGLFVIALIKE